MKETSPYAEAVVATAILNCLQLHGGSHQPARGLSSYLEGVMALAISLKMESEDHYDFVNDLAARLARIAVKELKDRLAAATN